MSDSGVPVPGDLSFGDALAELDRIVGQLEGGQLELEESIARYERGVGLLKALQSKLADAQQKVTVLIGELEEEGGGGSAPEASNSTDGDPTDEVVPF